MSVTPLKVEVSTADGRIVDPLTPVHVVSEFSSVSRVGGIKPDPVYVITAEASGSETTAVSGSVVKIGG
jgi:hypothetical protein